jgi:hypothetical protein
MARHLFRLCCLPSTVGGFFRRNPVAATSELDSFGKLLSPIWIREMSTKMSVGLLDI